MYCIKDVEYRAALDFYSQDKYKESVESFLSFARKLKTKDPDTRLRHLFYWELWNNLGNSFTRLKAFKKAETCFINALSCFTEDGVSYATGIVAYNYACMLFFEKKSTRELYKSYILFLLADKVGFKNGVTRKISESFFKNYTIYFSSADNFYNSRVYNCLNKIPDLRQYLYSYLPVRKIYFFT